MSAAPHPRDDASPRLTCGLGEECDGLPHRCMTCDGDGRNWRGVECADCRGLGTTPCPVASASRIEQMARDCSDYFTEREEWLAKMRLADGEPPLVASESHRASAVVVACCVVGVAMVAALVVILEALGLWVME